MSGKSKIRITQSLLSSWLWAFKKDDGYEDFLRTLNREPKQPTQAMLDGTQYENCLNGVLNGEHLPEDHKWIDPITEMAEELWGSQQQVVLYRDVEVDGQPILLHGILDYLKAGHIYDCKFSKNYHLNKYLDSPQTPMYLALVPEAFDFTYIVSDGKYVYRERYPRDIVQPIEVTLRYFMNYIRSRDELKKILFDKWSTDKS